MKTFDLTEENQQLFTELFEETGYHNYMQLRLIGVAKSKDVITVNRPNAVAKHVGHLADDVVTILVYEDAFDRLDEKNKKLLIRDAFNLISYDDEKDKIGIGTPMITVTITGRQKWGDELINAAELAVMQIQEIEEEKRQMREEEKARKAAEKAAKKQK
jgi:hypothetical protein